jgi:hypothetical protein
MAGFVMGEFDLGEAYPKLEPIIPASLCNTDCVQLKITPASDGTIVVVTTEEELYQRRKKSNQAVKAKGKADADSIIFFR